MTALLTGSDESHWQTAGPAFAQARAAAGDSFAIIKATDGTSTDQSSAAHYAAFGGVHIARGPYHFYRSSPDPIAQARYHVGKAGVLGHWELPSTCDYENASGADRPDDLYAYLCEVERLTQRTPILYTGPAFWRATIGSDPRFARFPLWLAEYLYKYSDGSHVPATIEVTAPAPWAVPSIWQFSDSSGRLDRDVMPVDVFQRLTGATIPLPPHQPPPSKDDDMTPAQEAKLDQALAAAAGAEKATVIAVSELQKANTQLAKIAAKLGA